MSESFTTNRDAGGQPLRHPLKDAREEITRLRAENERLKDLLLEHTEAWGEIGANDNEHRMTDAQKLERAAKLAHELYFKDGT